MDQVPGRSCGSCVSVWRRISGQRPQTRVASRRTRFTPSSPSRSSPSARGWVCDICHGSRLFLSLVKSLLVSLLGCSNLFRSGEVSSGCWRRDPELSWGAPRSHRDLPHIVHPSHISILPKQQPRHLPATTLRIKPRSDRTEQLSATHLLTQHRDRERDATSLMTWAEPQRPAHKSWLLEEMLQHVMRETVNVVFLFLILLSD